MGRTGLDRLDLLGGDLALEGNEHVLAPLVPRPAVPAGAQDQQLAVPSRQGVLRHDVTGEHQPALHHVGVVAERPEDVDDLAVGAAQALGEGLGQTRIVGGRADREAGCLVHGYILPRRGVRVLGRAATPESDDDPHRQSALVDAAVAERLMDAAHEAQGAPQHRLSVEDVVRLGSFEGRASPAEVFFENLFANIFYRLHRASSAAPCRPSGRMSTRDEPRQTVMDNAARGRPADGSSARSQRPDGVPRDRSVPWTADWRGRSRRCR